MIIAQQKKQENIVEYILYMWYIEDLIRANNFDVQQIEKTVIDRFEQPESVLREMSNWYRDLIERMKDEETEKGGHLGFLTEQVHQLNDLHLNLINDLNEPKYRRAYFSAEPYITELKKKSAPNATEIEVCLNALYMLMMIRMKGASPSTETVAAIETFGDMLVLLNDKFIKNNR